MKKAQIFYADIGDYLTREQKLKIIRNTKSIENLEMTELHPNKDGDWINLRNDEFAEYIPIAPEKKFDVASKSIFNTFAIGVATNRDIWVYGFSKETVTKNMKSMISFYNEEVERNKGVENKELQSDSKKISWTRSLKKDAEKEILHSFDEEQYVESIYRPFAKEHLYYHKPFIESPGLWKQLFPSKKHSNLVICVSGVGGSKEFSPLIIDEIPCMDLVEKSQCFPLYYYTENEENQNALFDEFNKDKYIRHDGITDWILKQSRSIYGKSVEKEDIFYYVYGFLHSKEYRTKYAADLKKMLPRIPLVDKKEDFWAFSKAGRQLANLHLHYETVEPISGLDVKFTGDMGNEYDYFSVEKLRFPSKDKKDTIIYNSHITISGIPEKAYEYIVNGKSAIEWIMDRYQVTVDKDSGIKNDCNDWAKEHKKPRYIYDLILSIINVSCQTVDIVNSLPKIDFGNNEKKEVVYPKIDENQGLLMVARPED